MGDQPSKFEFLDSSDSEESFANCDIALRGGRHIQNHHHEIRLYDYISNNYDELVYFYLKLFGLHLKFSVHHDNKYYFLDFAADSKGKYGGTRSAPLSARHTLFGLLLLKIHRLENYFGKNDIDIGKLKERLKNENNTYRDDIYRLFARVSGKGGATEPDETNIDTWIDNSLAKFEELGWIYFESTTDHFTILTSFNRLFELYLTEIKEFDKILDDSKKENQT
jgi:hypothetical protein